MTQSGKHGIFDGMLLNLLKMFTANSKFLETTPNSLSVILVKFEDQRSDTSHEMTQFGKHRIFRGIFTEVLKLIPYQLNYISNEPPTDGGVCLESVLRLSKKFRGRFMFSRLCLISLNTWAKILRHMEGYIFTIWNNLESLLRLSKKFRGMFRGRFCVYETVSF